MDPATPYRKRWREPPLKTYAVRTSPLVRRLFVLGFPVAALTLFIASTRMPTAWELQYAMPELLMMLVPAAFVLVVALVGYGPDRVAGGAAEILFFEDRLEIPAQRGAPLVFERDGLSLSRSSVVGSFMFVAVTEVQLLDLAQGELRRRVSSRIFESMEVFEDFVRDVERFKDGLPPSKNLPSSRGSGPRDAYDDRLDEELAALD